MSQSETDQVETYRERLRHITVDLSYADRYDSFEELIEFLAENSGVPIHLDPQARSDLQRTPSPLTLRLGNLTLERALGLLVTLKGLDLEVAADGVHIGLGSSHEPPVVEVHDIQDLTEEEISRTDLPVIEEEPAGDPPLPVQGVDFLEEERIAARMAPYSESRLIELIKENVDAGWDDFPRAALSFTRGKLVIRHQRGVHGRIRSYLAELRQLVRREIRLEAELVSHEIDLLRRVPFPLAPVEAVPGSLLEATLEPAQETALRQFLGRLGRTLAAKELVLRHGCPRVVTHAAQIEFPGSAAGSAGASQPAPRRIYDGIQLRLRLLLAPPSDAVTILLRAQTAFVPRPILTVPVPGGEIALPGQLVQTSELRLRTRLGATLVVAGLSNPFEDRAQRSHLLLLLRAHAL